MESQFKPTLTPREVILSGAFGGTYFRKIRSRVTGRTYENDHKKFDFFKGVPDSMMTLPWEDYNTNLNKYKVKVGSTLEEWEDHNWITKYDPRGWFAWYCNYHNGRRCSDDERQINRWLRISRFKKRLDNIRSSGKDSPALRQTLLHWAIST